jgi:hypothetical protein
VPSFWVLNCVRVGQSVRRPGTLVDDAREDLSKLRAAGGVLWDSSDPIVSAAAAVVARKRQRGATDEELSDVMIAAAASAANSRPSSGGTGGFSTDGVDFGPSSPRQTIFRALGAGDVVVRVAVDVVVPFDGAPTMRVGTTLADILGPGEVRLGTAGQYQSSELLRASVPDQLIVVFDPGGSTVGSAQVYAETKEYDS